MAMTPHDSRHHGAAPADGEPGGASGTPEDTSRLPALAQHFLWVDDPAAVQKLIVGLAVLCGLLFLLDLFIHRHAEVPGESLPGFYAIVGFVSFTVIVLGAKQLRVLIRRDENFYAPYGVDAEEYPAAGTDRRTSNGTLQENASEASDGPPSEPPANSARSSGGPR